MSDKTGHSLAQICKKVFRQLAKEISGVIVDGNRQPRTGFKVKLPVSDKAPTENSDKRYSHPCRQSLWQMLLYAFIGGLILNIMPCVLPVIALKILGFVGEARSEPRHVRKLGLVYALGVLVSFLALAAIVIGIKAAGHQAGWGMQFGSPVFIVCLTTLVMLVALNLFGVFEVSLGGRAMNAAGETCVEARHDGRIFQRRAGNRFGDALHRAVFEYCAGICFRAKRAGHRADVSGRWRRAGCAVCGVELESGVVEISAETGRMDGKDSKS